MMIHINIERHSLVALIPGRSFVIVDRVKKKVLKYCSKYFNIKLFITYQQTKVFIS